LATADCRLPIGKADCRLPIGKADCRLPIGKADWRLQIDNNRQSAIGNRQSNNRQSAAGSRQCYLFTVDCSLSPLAATTGSMNCR
jgi:hypothetical protein